MACAVTPSDADWVAIAGPTTVAAALRELGRWTFDTRRDFDAETWWFRARLPESTGPFAATLHLDGLATLAEVFIDGVSVLVSENMYHAHVVPLPAGARELTIRFDPLNAALAQKRPRPRWKTRLASHQQLRWIRTSLVGRMPGWSPPVAPVGPWRGVYVSRAVVAIPRPLETERTREMPPRDTLLEPISFTTGEIPAFVDSERNDSDRISLSTAEFPAVREMASEALTRRLAPGELESMLVPPAGPRHSIRVRVVDGTGIVEVHAELSGPVEHATLVVGDARAALAVEGHRVMGRVEVPNASLWWPHTHGTQTRYAARIETNREPVDLGTVAFRTIELDSEHGRFSVSVNGIPIFCRGAVWTSLDVATLTSSPEAYRRVLALVKDAGMNMLRLSGTLFYEDDAFYEACDELGILVWQDFMFANMDYPIADPAFRASVEREARQVLERLQNRACMAVFCGGSEVEQQAAMFGAPRELWRSELFAEVLPALVRELRPDVPYWFNSPAGGALPFHVNEGAGHYYGVGAYLRPFEDARRADVKFASECLAFANVPEDDLFPMFLAEGQAPFVHAKWKERTSKDNGSGWDFEDVRDHYVARLFRVDPAAIRYEDMERYLALSRVASGEAMARTLAEFRRAGSPTMGALVWFLQDLWPGAGWGVLDSRGLPKSAYWYLRRAMQPLALLLVDEGVNGLEVHVRNDTASAVEGTLEVTLYRDGETRTNGGEQLIQVAPRSARKIAVDALLPTFSDSAHAYRFGPSGHDVAVATLKKAETVLAEACWLTDFAKPPPAGGLEGTLGPNQVTVTTRRFAQAVRIVVPGHVAEDNYFDLAPGRSRTIALRPAMGAKPRSTITGTLVAVNLRTAVRLK
jgi:beta-mannosidase